MRLQKNLLIAFLLFTTTLRVNITNAEESTNIWSQRKGIRNYMSETRFFDRLDFFKTTANYHSLSPEEQVSKGREATRKALTDISVEYAHTQLKKYGIYGGIPLAATGVIFSKLPSHLIGSVLTSASPVVLTLAGFLFIGAGEQLYYIKEPPQLPEADLIVEYGAKRHLLNKVTRAYLEESIFYRFWQTENTDQYDKLVKVMDKALRMPMHAKLLVYDQEKTQEKLWHYSTELKNRLIRFAFSEIMIQKMTPKPEGHYPVYFYGSPGTGKTYAAKHLACAMGTNLATVTLDGANIDDIIGTSFDSLEAKPGLLLEAIVANTASIQDINHHNQVLLIDEFDRLFIDGDKQSQDILAFFLKILDPHHRYFYSPYLKTNIRLPDTIILAGNTDIHTVSIQNQQLQSMASRLERIFFDGFSSQTKQEIAFSLMIPKMEQSYKSISEELAEFSISEIDLTRIDNFIQSDSDPGLRSLEKFTHEIFEINLQQLGKAGLLQTDF
ncbi:hypothetical protein GV64_01110 [Endozoicomonas elysicola]|uniref:AAA+ ATPase domain-containing protein n=2 Tax=Endozoicomonas elysicola TaxID=305900 RepID=A0A081K5U7_9GAMM|nr:hypothetical protein GV64_01110 [Endozoicomonas elysicola]